MDKPANVSILKPSSMLRLAWQSVLWLRVISKDAFSKADFAGGFVDFDFV